MKVYYNESCKICRAEVNLYKKQNIKEIEWVDITNNTAAEKNTSKDNKTLLEDYMLKREAKYLEELRLFYLFGKKYQNINSYILFLNYQ